MSFRDSGEIAAHYAALLATHGDHRRAVGWEQAHIQRASFAQILRLDGLRSGASVLDLGCGLGHLFDFLREAGLELEYTGWDISPDLVARARQERPDARFQVRDLLAEPPAQPFDFVVASGTFNLRLPDHERWLADMIRAMFASCRRGVYCNLLSAQALARDPFAEAPEYFYALPAGVLGLCLELTPQVLLDHAELAHSFAVYMYRDNQEPMGRTARSLGLGARFGDGHRAVSDHYASFHMHRELLAYLDTLEPSAALYDHMGLIAFQAGDGPRQLDAFARAVALEPDDPRYLEHLAIAYLDAERPDDALPLLRKAHALAPDDPDIAHRLAALERDLSP